MRKFLLTLTSVLVVACIIVIYNFYNPPRSRMTLLVPVHTLERLGFNEGDLSFMLSDNSGCEQRYSKHNFTVMSGNEGNWNDVPVWSQHVTLYLTWQEIWQITDEIQLCIRFKNQWESVWNGEFSLKATWDLYVAQKSFICNRKDLSSKWECSSYEITYDKREEIYKLQTKYGEKSAPNTPLISE